jgi:hypothetical protein
MSVPFRDHALPAAIFEFEGDEPSEQSSRVELPDDRFESAEAAGERLHRQNIAIADRGERHEAEIGQIICESRTLHNVQPRKRMRRKQINHPVEPDEDLTDGQMLRQDGAGHIRTNIC